MLENALKQLLNNLDAVFEEHEEVGDTAVREAMYDAMHKAFIVPQPGYQLPGTYEMFSDGGDARVHNALEAFLKHPEFIAALEELETPEARLSAFQNLEVESDEGNTHDEYFGYADSP